MLKPSHFKFNMKISKSNPCGVSHYVKVLSYILEVCGMKYFRTAAHVQVILFSKKKVFLKQTNFFVLRNKHILTKVIFFKVREKWSKYCYETLLDFADASSDLTFKPFAWKRGSTMFSADLSDPSLENSFKILPSKVKFVTL